MNYGLTLILLGLLGLLAYFVGRRDDAKFQHRLAEARRQLGSSAEASESQPDPRPLSKSRP